MNLTLLNRKTAAAARKAAQENSIWLQDHMSQHFFQAMADEPEALLLMAREMRALRNSRRLILADREKLLAIACVNSPGSLYNTMQRIGERSISYAMFYHSDTPMPDTEHKLEVLRLEFDRRSNQMIDLNSEVHIPAALVKRIRRELRNLFPDFNLKKTDRLLKILWLNNENYVRMYPPADIAYLLWLFDQSNAAGGIFVDIAKVEPEELADTRVLFAVANPPEGDFLLQALEVFNRMDIGIKRASCQIISNGNHPYFLGSFYVKSRRGEDLSGNGPAAAALHRELCTTQILSTKSPLYRDFVTQGRLSGDDASLLNAFISFCHTTLAHSKPDIFSPDEIQKSFGDHPEMQQSLTRLFRIRFDPEIVDREELYRIAHEEAVIAVEGYNTGHRWLDKSRRTIYRCCLLLITHTLKTNFFVPEKQALAFRLDPGYLRLIGEEFISDLPDQFPFRVTFFFSRFGAGYHIGFSDIARGGWRTVIARSSDDFITTSTSIFREVYVLAHTQHLKNKDIYEGGSKLALALDASDLKDAGLEAENCRLYKLQYGVANAFLDIFITENGKAKDPRIVDYYGDDEPIELGPDENMHDEMIEAIAKLSRKRGYILGIGIMSSKRFGINHKHYGVTSVGIAKFVEITMAETIGIDIANDPFTLKMTGGPNGDVAGNCLRILLERCPAMQVQLILDGTAAVYDPFGISREELSRIVLKHDLDAFDPEALGEGGYIIYRTSRRKDGVKETHLKIRRSEAVLTKKWLETDDFYQVYNSLVFTVKADLFIPAGGRPESIDKLNWQQFLGQDGKPSARVIVEGANSYITPEARLQLQRNGVVIMRDSSANKCGVISSSYEIIANLLLSEDEFLDHKEQYIHNVLEILEKRAIDEARLILSRASEPGNELQYTEISEAISRNINNFYSKIFEFFSEHPDLCHQNPFLQAILDHLPRILRDTARFRTRINNLPQKYLCAILAAEIGSSLVYSHSINADFEDMLRRHLSRVQ